MNEFEQLCFDFINNSAPEIVTNNGEFKLIANDNKTRKQFSSIFFVAKPSVYRSAHDLNITIATVKKSGKSLFIMFSKRFQKLFDDYNISYSSIESENFIRLDSLQIHSAINEVAFSKIIEQIVLSSFNFASYGCCSRYKECSNQRKCIHPDYFYASASCQYKKHLEAGQIFY